jgi:RNA polymerase subunit RPABC4/transcription elongation factor Spt4
MLSVQVATIRQFCPVCQDSDTPGRTLLDGPAADSLIEIDCPHCTDATQLKRWLGVFRDQVS